MTLFLMNLEALSITRTLKGNQAPFVVQELPEIAKHSDKGNIIDAIKLILIRKKVRSLAWFTVAL